MISLEGLTLTTGRHARGGLHPAHVRPLRPRRPDPQPVPRRRATRGSTTPPTPRSGSSTPSTATSTATGDRDTLRLLLPKLRDIVEHHLAGHALRHRRRSGGRPAAPGRGGLPAHLDGRQGRRLGGDAAARQGGGDQRPLVQRPPPARGLDCASDGRRGRAARSPSTPSSAARVVQPPLLVRARAATSTTWSTARTAATTRPAGPNQLFAISLTHPVLDRARWAAGARRRRASSC